MAPDSAGAAGYPGAASGHDDEIRDAEIEEDEAAEPALTSETVQSPDPLPTMADLDRVASDLDGVDARLAALDEHRL